MSLFTGKTVLVTGAASGIGAAMCRRVADGGGHVVLADVDVRAGQALAEELAGVFVRTDVADVADNVAAVRTAVESFGRLDIAHLNAGIPGSAFGRSRAELPVDIERYRRVMAVNLDGVVIGVRAAVDQFRRQGGGGAILATASMAGVHPTPGGEIYSASKHAVVGLIRSLAPLLRHERISLNALCPACVDTPMLRTVLPALRATTPDIEIVSAAHVAAAAEHVLATRRTGGAWQIDAGEHPRPIPVPTESR
ncbi:SDR family NAD(P)-dependent oxidoreductase [Nocardia aurantia]|uniref:3-phenylpropionate-dihydrodiol/cinnamic acid-dihydrodiol dehydrogenase n=1 Tax=Nocardia aurantia TaxID=2585199 RepID=A0A7K0DX51_9NOCA|nr:SDR family NAD(P)-dependent oxidoreductase [Nocardia aurantia]MQY30363.1 3-phenylpropionate-dihydrodiol/cinnamic acid-dihydrodiol dehydrogenase [Nocardia aurantia]